MKTAWIGQTPLIVSIAALLLAPLGCEKPVDDPPSVSELTPDEAAAQGAEFYCGYAARCVTGVNTCDGEAVGGASDDGTSECTVVAGALDQASCEESVTDEFEEYFGCTDLSKEDEAVLDDCVLALRDNECDYGGGDEGPESGVDAMERASMEAQTIDDLRFPEICEEAIVLLSDCVPDSAAPGEPTPID